MKIKPQIAIAPKKLDFTPPPRPEPPKLTVGKMMEFLEGFPDDWEIVGWDVETGSVPIRQIVYQGGTKNQINIEFDTIGDDW